MCGSCWRWRAEHSRTWSGCTAPYRHILNQADPTPLTSSTLIHWSEPMFSILRNLKVMLTRCLKPKNYCMFDQKCMWICGGLLNLCMFAYLPSFMRLRVNDATAQSSETWVVGWLRNSNFKISWKTKFDRHFLEFREISQNWNNWF